MTQSVAPLVTVAVVFRNEENNLPGLLESIKKQWRDEFTDTFHFLFIDNNSTDSSSLIIKEWSQEKNAKIQYLSRSTNSMAGARQQCLEKALSPWVAFVDADSSLETDWFDSVLKSIERADEATSVIGGCSKYTGEQNWHSFVQALWVYFPLGKKQGVKTKVSHVPSNNYLLKRQEALKAGGFDPFFDLVGEDLDLNVRINHSGSIYYDPRFMVSHKLPDSVYDWYRKMALYGRAQSFVAIKYFGSVPKEKFIPLLLVFLLVLCILQFPEPTLFILTISLLIERSRFFVLTFLFYGLGELVGGFKAVFSKKLLENSSKLFTKRPAQAKANKNQ